MFFSLIRFVLLKKVIGVAAKTAHLKYSLQKPCQNVKVKKYKEITILDFRWKCAKSHKSVRFRTCSEVISLQ